MLTIQDLDIFQELSPYRGRRLFNEFLPKGYALTTLDTVAHNYRDKVIDIKIILGSIITLYDDYADRPDSLNSRLLGLLYRIPFEKIVAHDSFLNKKERKAFKFATSLFEKLFLQMKDLPNYEELIKLFNFDLKQFFLANQYAEQLTKKPYLVNKLENRLYLHHNMGITMAGMIDLMSLPHLKLEELGISREIFLLGQRAGRISNIVTTFEREQHEGDVTNEILIQDNKQVLNRTLTKIERERETICRNISLCYNCSNFSAKAYSNGMIELHKLHLNFKGLI